MELIILIIIANLVVNAVKASKAKMDETKKRMEAAGQGYGRGFAPGTFSAAAPAAKPNPAPVSAPRQIRPEVSHRVMEPKVHTHLAPDCEVHDRPGSLKVTSMEGKDLCHASQLAPADMPRTTVEEPQETSGLQLDWSGENMVRAFVMQEVLTRPCDRRRRA